MVALGKEWLNPDKDVFGQSGFNLAKWLYSRKVVVFGQSGCIRAKVVVLGQSGCIRAKVVLIGQMWFYSGKVVVFGQSGCIREKVVSE